MRFETGLSHGPSPNSVWTKIERLVTARRGAFTLAVIVLASLAFRLHVSNECSLWLDETTTQRGVLKPWPAVLAGPSREHPPLMYVLVRLVFDVFGPSTTALRSVSLFFGCVLLVALHELCLELRLPVKRALIVVGAFALSPFFIRHATEARHYALLASFVTLGLTRVLRLLRGRPRGRDLAGFVLCGMAAAATQYFGLAYALALLGTLGAGIRPVWRRSMWPGRVALLTSLGALLAVLAFIAMRAVARFGPGKSSAGAGPKFELSEQLLHEMIGQFPFMAYETWAWFIQPSLVFVGLSLLSWRLRGAARLLPFGIGLVPCVAALFIPATHFLTARYLAPSAVLCHLAACSALFAAYDRARTRLVHGERSALALSLVGGAALAGLVGARVREFPRGYSAGGDDYRGLQRYFVDNLAKDTRVVAYVGYIGQLLFDEQYRLGSRIIKLENFQPVAGIDRYLVIELHTGGRQAAFESLLQRKLGLSRETWRALPLVAVPHSVYQPAVKARLIQLPSDFVPPPAPKRRPRKR